MYEWVNLDNGSILKTESRYLKNCPKCGTSNDNLHSNRYKDLYVTNGEYQDISISINMIYCNKCCELYIRNDY